MTIPLCLFIVFGATGDLSRRKLLPELYRLARRGFLTGSHILGVARSDKLDDQSFRELAAQAINSVEINNAAAVSEWCEHSIHYRTIHEGGENDFRDLGVEIQTLEKQYGLPGHRVFYLALPPQSFSPTIEAIGRCGLNRSPGWTRIVIEKPFGRDLKSSQELNNLIHRFFDEDQTYRIDHYLGKETVQNLHVFRFANPIFESLWNRDRIDNVQITVAEEIGVEGRAAYYDNNGALRDMVQNHLTQLLSLVAMEVPAGLDAESVRDEKVKVLRSIAPIKKADVVFGQYTGGKVSGVTLPGYREEAGVPKDSQTPTAVALKLQVANWRWNGVPFYLRTGKRMPRRTSQVAIVFNCAPVSIFQPFGPACDVRSNVLIITIQPHEGFNLRFEVKNPGQPLKITTQDLRFRYDQVFSSIPDGYQTLLQEVLLGDRSLFVRADWVERSWTLYDPILNDPPPVYPYPAGTWGPFEADKLLANEKRQWII